MTIFKISLMIWIYGSVELNLIMHNSSIVIIVNI